MIYLSFSIICN